MMKMPHLEDVNDGRKAKKYSQWSAEDRALHQAADKLISRLKKNPPFITGWLRGGIDVGRMTNVALEWEDKYAL